MTCYHGDLVGIVDGEMCIYEDEEIGNCPREGEGRGEKCPGMRVGVENDGEERGRWTWVLLDAGLDERM